VTASRQESPRLPKHNLHGRKTPMAWLILFLAGLFETGWAIGLKYTDGFTRLWPTVWTVFAMIVSLWLLGIAVKTLPVGTAYSVWVGVGAVGTVILGIALLGEPANAARLISVGLIIAGIIGLKLASPA
jgi:quaternary ammonium compound-resistance protein SugE